MTLGQDYYWAVEATSNAGKINLNTREFEIVAPINNKPFSSVTVITHGFNLIPTPGEHKGIPKSSYQMADKIVGIHGEDKEGLILRYDKPTGNWVPVEENGLLGWRDNTELTNGLKPDQSGYMAILGNKLRSEYKNRPIILLTEWSTNQESTVPDSGFTEGAADAFFASMVKLDQQLGGKVGEEVSVGDGIYDESGKLRRQQGYLFNSPMHFIGFSRGTVVNSEIIQRLGKYYPLAGGFQADSEGNRIGNGDLHMTTIDPHDFAQEGLDIPVGELTTKALEKATELIKDPLTRKIAEGFVRFASEITGFNQETLEYSDFKEPPVQVWDNISFADNYYQTTNTGNNPTNLTPNGRKLVNVNPDPYSNSADLNLDLTEFRGFKGIEAVLDNPIGGAHSKVLAWYAGTVDQALERTDNEFVYERDGIEIQDRKGEVNVENWYDRELDPSAPLWYSSSTIPDEYDPEEGIGTGWYYSYLNGGERTFDNPARSTVTTAFDNTLEPRSRGDFAVPTIFNGNFDASFSGNSESVLNNGVRNVWGGAIPGWSYHNGRLDQFDPNGAGDLKYGINIENLVDWKNINSLSDDYRNQVGYDEEQPNFALKMDGGDSIVHNPFFVPDWGVLRFDVHAPKLGGLSDTSNYITAWIEDNNGNFVQLKSKDPKTYAPDFDDTGYDKNPLFPAVDLRNVEVFNPITIQGQTNRVDYGQTNFETFFVDIPLEFRNRSRKIKFEVKGNKTVFIDNVFIGSYNLRFGVPKFNQQEARDELSNNFNRNYLSEKPQFSLSYNSNTRLPNWVNWSLDNSWISDLKTPRPSFAEDISLPFPGERVVDEDYSTDFEKPPYNRGHLAAASDRKRTAKDSYATFLTSNVVPQSFRSNAGDSPWNAFEEHLQNLAKQGKEIHILAGSIKSPEPPLLETDQPLTGIEIPNHTWKLAVVLKEPGLNANEIQKDNATLIEDAIAIIVPNIELDATFSEGTTFPIPAYPYTIPIESQEEWQDWENWQVSYRELQKATDLRFLTGLNAKTRDFIHGLSLPNPSSSLLAETEFISSSSSVFGTNQSSAIGHDSVVEKSPISTQESFDFFTSEESTFKISPDHDRKFQLDSFEFSLPQDSVRQVGTFEIRTRQIGFGEVDSSKIGAPEIGISQIGVSQTFGSQVSPFENSIAEISTSRPRSAQNSSRKIGVSQVGSNEIDVRQFGSSQIRSFKIDSSKVSFSSSVSPEQFFSFHNSTPQIINELNNNATNIWSDLLQTSTQLDIDFQVTDLPTGQLAEATITSFDDSGKPDAGTIEIDHDANGVGWFIDPTPLNNSEFTAQNTDSYLLAAAESEAHGKYDLLTTVLHELAHLYGFIDGYQGFNANIETEDGTTKFVGDDFEAVLDGEHLDKSAHPYDLLNTHLAPGIRKLPSELDVEILQALIATELEKNGSKPAGDELLASLTSDPLLAIANGDFSISDTTTDSFAWDTRGASGIEDGQAVLTEDSPFLSNFTQTFTVPEEAKTIQFKLIGAELGASELAPPDAFEVALLDANTNESLTAVSDLSNTDFLLNIQNDFPKLLVLY